VARLFLFPASSWFERSTNPLNMTQPRNALDALKQFTTVVADTGRFDLMAQYQPQDATTNPSLILKAVATPGGEALMRSVLARSAAGRTTEQRVLDLLVAFGCEILKIIPGRVSTEVDARLSFDTQATVDQAMAIVQAYRQAGVDPKRVLIKIAATWEGIAAARLLEQEGVACNLTLLFSMAQAMACADAGVTLISPFVGRISDWAKARGQTWDSADQDPGVLSVRGIFQAYKAQDIRTQIMGASFRNPAQVMALAGCDLLTVSPELLLELSTQPAPSGFVPPLAAGQSVPRAAALSEAQFRFDLNQDAMASEKLAEGIRLFYADGEKLKTLLASAG
jgi:transaldolase